MTPWTVVQQAPLSMEFSRQEHWSGLPFPSPEDLPDPGIKPRSLTLKAESLPSETPYRVPNTCTPFYFLCYGVEAGTHVSFIGKMLAFFLAKWNIHTYNNFQSHVVEVWEHMQTEAKHPMQRQSRKCKTKRREWVVAHHRCWWGSWWTHQSQMEREILLSQR